MSVVVDTARLNFILYTIYVQKQTTDKLLISKPTIFNIETSQTICDKVTELAYIYGFISGADQLSVFVHTERLNVIFILFSLSVCTKTDNWSVADV